MSCQPLPYGIRRGDCVDAGGRAGRATADLVDGTGTKVNSYSHDPYGVSRATEAVPKPFQYPAGHLDDATGP